MHNVLDRFSKALEEEGLTWQDIDREWCDEAVAIIVDDMIQKYQDIF
ncbi:ATP-dependent nuclease subunit B [Thermoanaerobacter ethanolicus JW 200]|nr:ATP-dependent nuclease subunit B [Thermoanaerobacter ethanolicus JW 200]